MKCLVCGTFNMHPDDPEWCCEPFCWKCGTYLAREGNRGGISGGEARQKASDFDARIDAILVRASDEKVVPPVEG